MFRRAYRSILSLNERRVRRQFRKAEAHGAWPLPFDELAAESARAQAEYRKDWEDYTQRVSSPSAAASLEVLGLTVALLRLTEAQSIMDTGSGFSTFVYRRESIRLGKRHVCIEDHPGWLEKTRAYLADHDLPTTDIHLWSDIEYDRQAFEPCDLVFHDMGNMSTRLFALPWMTRHLSPSGVLVLDDMHKPHYRISVEGYLHDGWSLQSALRLTEDGLRRFSFLAARSPVEEPATNGSANG